MKSKLQNQMAIASMKKFIYHNWCLK